jgi:hypothetical protein
LCASSGAAATIDEFLRKSRLVTSLGMEGVYTRLCDVSAPAARLAGSAPGQFPKQPGASHLPVT